MRAAPRQRDGAACGEGGSAALARPVRVEDLRARWRSALAAAEAALAAARRFLPATEIRERSSRLDRERAETRRLLQALARDRRVVLLSADEARRLLGLPAAIEGCVFTLDGVLVGSAAVHAAAWKQTFDEFLAQLGERARGRFDMGRLEPFDPDREYREHLHGKSRLEGVRAFLASRGIRLPEGRPTDPPGRATVCGLANRKSELLQRLLAERRLDPYEGARRYLEVARDAGIRCAVVSASAHTDAILERAGLADLIDARVDADVIVAERLPERPAPDRLLAACRKLNVPPAHAVAFETTTAGVAAGRAAGFRLVIAVDRSEQRSHAEALRAEGADIVVDDLARLLERPPAR